MRPAPRRGQHPGQQGTPAATVASETALECYCYDCIWYPGLRCTSGGYVRFARSFSLAVVAVYTYATIALTQAVGDSSFHFDRLPPKKARHMVIVHGSSESRPSTRFCLRERICATCCVPRRDTRSGASPLPKINPTSVFGCTSCLALWSTHQILMWYETSIRGGQWFASCAKECELVYLLLAQGVVSGRFSRLVSSKQQLLVNTLQITGTLLVVFRSLHYPSQTYSPYINQTDRPGNQVTPTRHPLETPVLSLDLPMQKHIQNLKSCGIQYFPTGGRRLRAYHFPIRDASRITAEPQPSLIQHHGQRISPNPHQKAIPYQRSLTPRPWSITCR